MNHPLREIMSVEEWVQLRRDVQLCRASPPVSLAVRIPIACPMCSHILPIVYSFYYTCPNCGVRV